MRLSAREWHDRIYQTTVTFVIELPNRHRGKPSAGVFTPQEGSDKRFWDAVSEVFEAIEWGGPYMSGVMDVVVEVEDGKVVLRDGNTISIREARNELARLAAEYLELD